MRIALATVLAGCLSVPTPGPTMCSTTDDCDSANGEVCSEGTCWGDPPAGPFAAILTPPKSRGDLVGTDLAQLMIPAHGYLSNLTLEAPVTFAGRVTANCGNCDPLAAVDAQIVVRRPARFAGGPAFQVAIVSDGSVAQGNSFSAPLPRTEASDPPYEVTITPKDDGVGRSAAQLVPPKRLPLTLTDNSGATFTLGSDTPVVLTGNVLDSEHFPLADYRVFAVGHWDPNEPPTIVSTIDYTTNGQYHIELSEDLVDTVEIVAQPFAMGVTGPTLHLPHVGLSTSSQDLVAPPALGKAVTVFVKITGKNSDGSVTGIVGAQVGASATVTPTLAGPGLPTHATFDASAVTDVNGVAQLILLDGTAFSYAMQVVPPAGSTVSATFGQPLAVTCTNPDPADGCTTRLTPRITIHGVITDGYGNPVKGMTVTAKPALSFMFLLPADPQQFLSQIPPATSVTVESGEYFVQVDQLVDNVWGTYDLDLEPADITETPHWSEPNIVLPRDTTVTDVQHDIQLSMPAYIHGAITDPVGTDVAQGELRVYAVPVDASCSGVVGAPPNCQIPAIQVAHAVADDSGTVKFTLAR